MYKGEIVISSAASHLQPSCSVVNRKSQRALDKCLWAYVVVMLLILGVVYFGYSKVACHEYLNSLPVVPGRHRSTATPILIIEFSEVSQP